MTASIAQRVRDLLHACHAGPDASDVVVVQGIVGLFILRRDQLEAHRAEIAALCDLMPDPFHKSKGGGWSFLNLCNTRDGEQWTGLHRDCEALVVLALGAGLGGYNLPPDHWEHLPGAVPYVFFDTLAAPA